MKLAEDTLASIPIPRPEPTADQPQGLLTERKSFAIEAGVYRLQLPG
jgi:hypothetical protein